VYAQNPCLTCGACCAAYRVAFYWAEADPTLGGTVPPELTEPLPPFRACMRGTNQSTPRCVALQGKIGEAVFCSIYALRPTPCREFGAQWQEQERRIVFAPGDQERCNRTRAAWGLPALI